MLRSVVVLTVVVAALCGVVCLDRFGSDLDHVVSGVQIVPTSREQFPVVDPDAYVIYAKAANCLATERPGFFVMKPDTMWTDPDANMALKVPDVTSEWQAAARSYYRNNVSIGWRLQAEPLKGFAVLEESTVTRSIFRLSPDAGPIFADGGSNFRGFVDVSAVGFDYRHRHALVSVHVIQSGGVNRQAHLALEKRLGKWTFARLDGSSWQRSNVPQQRQRANDDADSCWQ